MNFMISQHFGETDASSPPRWKTLDKRKAWGGFWRSLYRKVTIFIQNAIFDEIHIFRHISMKMVGNRGIPHILALWAPRNMPRTLRLTRDFTPGGEGPALSPKIGYFNGIYLNMAKFTPFW